MEKMKETTKIIISFLGAMFIIKFFKIDFRNWGRWNKKKKKKQMFNNKDAQWRKKHL